ncbi:TIGR01244 family sulfur transferase [Litoreibacter roseus]|uniref:TIGR01244 family protein n=1 Tax=Litoreibacter roseus TaxID=2601869 RepID=A0A6N6JEL1_9RHOB|nr:protein tyrosine phosphatase family protein [Litoreibacter roseus]GFE63652.1 TIGR01244 family protein [Litoreibacter roseus]
MDIRPLSPDFAVAPQITVADVALLADAGFTHVICNRPPRESAPDERPDVIRDAVVGAGMGFTDNPVSMNQMTLDHIEVQGQAMTGKVLAYCASGTRSAVLWALAQAGKQPTDDIIKALTDAGYPLEQLRSQIDTLAQRQPAP